MFGHDHTVAMREVTGEAAFGRDFSQEDRRKSTGPGILRKGGDGVLIALRGTLTLRGVSLRLARRPEK